jgi:hypothetical protein
MKRLFVTFWIDDTGNYRLPSVSFQSRYTLKFKETEERKISLPDNFIKAFNENWGNTYKLLTYVGYLYKSEISINI